MKRFFILDNLSSRFYLLLFFLLLFFLPSKALIITESLKKSSTPNFIFGGDAYLTSNNDDPNGDGWLRLTKDSVNRTGYALLKQGFPAKLGFTIEFDFMVWHSNKGRGGADGINVFLYDANTVTFKAGAYGGSLGYAQRVTGSRKFDGLSNGFLGLGIDELGNYSNPTEGRVGGPGPVSNSIGLRGPASTEYAWLIGSKKLPYRLSLGEFPLRPNVDSLYRSIRIEFSPISRSGSSYQYTVTALLKKNKTDDFVTVFGPYLFPHDTPDSLKLGFAASTGSNYNKHDVRNLVVTASGGVRIQKSVDKSTAYIGEKLTYTVEMVNDVALAANGLKLSDIFSQPSCFKIDSVLFKNSNNTVNKISGYSLTDLSKITVDLAPYGHCQMIVKGQIISYPESGVITNTATLDMGNSGILDFDITNNTSVVSTNIMAISILPIANSDSVTVRKDQSVIIPILDNDLPGNTSLDLNSIEIIDQPLYGSIFINSDGTISYNSYQSFSVEDQFTYIVKNLNGNVSNVASVQISKLERDLFIPNVFTPNGDGANEYFEIIGLESYTNAELTIFNRWGSEVYHNTSYQNDWDSGGLNEGTYYYILKLIKDDKLIDFKGWVLIKR